jgi:hypothetical protein
LVETRSDDDEIAFRKELRVLPAVARLVAPRANEIASRRDELASARPGEDDERVVRRGELFIHDVHAASHPELGKASRFEVPERAKTLHAFVIARRVVDS